MWVAIKPFRYRDQSYKAGDPVPAEEWPGKKALMLTRKIRQVPDSAESESPAGTENVTKSQDLSAMKRAELNTYAASLGIENPESYSKRASLMEKIQSATSATPTPPPTLPEDPAKPEVEEEDPFADLEDEEEEETEEDAEYKDEEA